MAAAIAINISSCFFIIVFCLVIIEINGQHKMSIFKVTKTSGRNPLRHLFYDFGSLMVCLSVATDQSDVVNRSVFFDTELHIGPFASHRSIIL